MAELEHAIKHIKTRADAWAVKEVTEALQSISERLDKALSQEPCGDAIDRAEAMTEIMMSKSITAFDRDLWIRTKDAVHILRELPPVTQKSGKWIKIKSGDKDFPESIVCSRCSNENSHLDFNENAEPIGKVFVTSKFCPNCGVRMVKPQESEDKE